MKDKMDLVLRGIREGVILYIVTSYGERKLVTHADGKYYVDGQEYNELLLRFALLRHYAVYKEDWEMDIEFLEEKYVV